MGELRLATIVYARLDGDHAADGAGREIGRRGESMLCEAAAHWGGDVVKRLGDGALITFGRSSDAIMAAVAIEQRLDRDRRSHGDASIGTASIGISVGEISDVGDDIAGLPVVEAARLAGVADAGSILGSPYLDKLAHPSDQVRFSRRDPVELRGFAEPVSPLAIDWTTVAEVASRTPLPEMLAAHADRFVGRADEIERLTAFLGQSAGVGPEGNGEQGARLATIVGDPGMGKTALAAAVASELRTAGALVLVGRSAPEGIVAYQPFREALYDLAARHPRGDAVFAAQRDDLASILDPDAVQSSDGRADARLALLYDALADLLGQLCRQQPVVFVLDDVQWLDSSSRRLVEHVLRVTVDEPLSVLATARPSELATSGVDEMLRDVARTVPVQRHLLDGLSEDEIADLAGGLPDRQRARFHQRTGGNPFLVKELVSADAVGDDATTFRAESLVAARLDRLSEAVRKVLAVAAVQGRSFDPGIVSSCAGGDPDDALDHLDLALDAGVLTESASGDLRLEFDHDLLREALLDGLSGLRRARVHKRLAEALAERARPDTYGEIARHFAAASELGDRAIACRYHLLAGDHALQVDAPDLALDWFDRAKEFVVDDRDRVAADSGRGRAMRAAGDPNAREAFHEAADLAHRIGDAEGMAKALLADYRGTFGIALAVDVPRVDRLRSALDLAGPAPTPVRARLLASLAVELVWAEDWTEAISLADEALAVVDQAEASSDVRADVLALRQWVIYHPTSTRRRDADELRRLVDVGGDMARQFEVAGQTVFTEMRAGDRAAMSTAIELARWLAERIDQPLTHWMLAQRESCIAMMEARFEDARGWITRASELGAATDQPDAGPMFVVQNFWLAYETAEPEEQRLELERMMAALDFLPPTSWPSLVFRCHEVGMFDEARLVYDKLAADDFALPRDLIWLWSICQIAPVAAAFEPERAPDFIEQLLPHRDEFANMQFSTSGPVARSLGLLRVATGDQEAAVEDFERALAVAERLQSPGWAARVRLDLADLLVELDDEARAKDLRATAARDAELLGMPLVLHRARSV